MKTKQGNLILETQGHVEGVFDRGDATHFVHLPPIGEIVKVCPTPLLEDLFQLVSVELQIRDSEDVSGIDARIREWEK